MSRHRQRHPDDEMGLHAEEIDQLLAGEDAEQARLLAEDTRCTDGVVGHFGAVQCDLPVRHGGQHRHGLLSWGMVEAES